MKAHLRFHHKAYIQQKFIVELSFYDIEKSKEYPLGVKYALICKDIRAGFYVLLDNHHPKGPHLHINDNEFPYEYKSEEKLVSDFEQIVFEKMGVKL